MKVIRLSLIARHAERWLIDLTATEAKIAAAVARGLSNKEIANEFHVSVRTVEHHVRSILAKKNFSIRVEIALYIKEQTT